jgi:hypothetical protein
MRRSRADGDARRRLPDIVGWVYWKFPSLVDRVMGIERDQTVMAECNIMHDDIPRESSIGRCSRAADLKSAEANIP